MKFSKNGFFSVSTIITLPSRCIRTVPFDITHRKETQSKIDDAKEFPLVWYYFTIMLFACLFLHIIIIEENRITLYKKLAFKMPFYLKYALRLHPTKSTDPS